jgi:hypothetical protein
MLKYSIFFLFISFFFLVFNGSALGFIFYQERLGDIFGIIFYSGTSLLGALCASIAFEKKSTYYSKLFFYSHLVVTFLPFYYLGISRLFLTIP